MESHLVDLLSWLEPRALLLALVLPPVIRIVGHWIPEELFMICMGVLANRSTSTLASIVLLTAVLLSHFVTDLVTYVLGRWLQPRLCRFPRIADRLEVVTCRLASSPRALYALIPGRVLPLCRGAWLLGCGVVQVSWARFIRFDILALLAHLLFWSGFGWWLADDLGRLAISAEVGKISALWLLVACVGATTAVGLWRRRMLVSPATSRAIRLAGRSLRQLGVR